MNHLYDNKDSQIDINLSGKGKKKQKLSMGQKEKAKLNMSKNVSLDSMVKLKQMESEVMPP